MRQESAGSFKSAVISGDITAQAMVSPLCLMVCPFWGRIETIIEHKGEE